MHGRNGCLNMISFSSNLLIYLRKFKYHDAQVKTAKMHKINDNKCWQGCGKGEHLFAVGRMKTGLGIMKMSAEILQKSRNRSTT